MVRVPGRAKPVAASCVAILPRAACWAGLTSMRHTVSDPRFPYLSTVFYWGHVGRQRMPGTGIAGYIAGWQPSSVSPQAAGFARMVVTGAAPGGQERAKNLLWAAGRLADWAIGLGLDPVPEVLLHSSVIERFAAHAPGLTRVTRRTLRTNLRFLARAVVPALAPADVPLPRERAKAPYAPAEIDGYLALAAAQPTAARRMRAAGLVCLGAGAGLIRADLRAVRGSDITRRSGGVIADVHGRRPRAVPVLACYHELLLA